MEIIFLPRDNIRTMSIRNYIENFDQKFSKIEYKPTAFSLILPLLSIARYFHNPRIAIRQCRLLLHRYRSYRLESVNHHFLQKSKPDIEILIVVGDYDIELLHYSIPLVILNTKNSISKLTIITPEKCKIEVEKVLAALSFSEDSVVITDEELISESIRKELFAFFQDRYGWVLQQLISVRYLEQATSEGVLLLDADTLIMNPIKWLDSSGKQILMASPEFHDPYYRFLSKHFCVSPNPRYTHITHHMLFIPKIYNQMLNDYGIHDLKNLVSKLKTVKISDSNAPFSIDFEPYAQYIMHKYGTRVTLTKFANLSVKRSQVLGKSIEELRHQYSEYNSISAHHHLE